MERCASRSHSLKVQLAFDDQTQETQVVHVPQLDEGETVDRTHFQPLMTLGFQVDPILPLNHILRWATPETHASGLLPLRSDKLEVVSSQNAKIRHRVVYTHSRGI